jgi:hypothetical protein
MNPKLIKARELIKAKQYQEARHLLKTIDDPGAIHLLQALDSVVPEPPVVVVRRTTQPLPEAPNLSPEPPAVEVAAAPHTSPASEKPMAISDATISRFPEGKDKIQMLKAGELLKAGNFAQAQAILEKIDHPKAREWRQRIEKQVHKAADNQSTTTKSVVDTPPAKRAGIRIHAKYQPNANALNSLPLVIAIALLIAGIIGLTVIDTIEVGWLEPVAVMIPPLLIGSGLLGLLWAYNNLNSQ